MEGARRTCTAALTLLLTAIVALPVAGHDFWIEPSTFRPKPGATVKVGLRVGDHLNGEAIGRNPRLIQRFFVQGLETQPVVGRAGADPAGLVRLAHGGAHWIGYQGKASFLELSADKFEGYLREEGLERISQLRAKPGDSYQGTKEAFFRSAKALLCPESAEVSSSGAGSQASRASSIPLDLTLELIPTQDLCGAHPGEPLSFQLRYLGQPLAGALVTALNRDAPQERVAVRSDVAGQVRFDLPRPGLWLIKAVHMVPAQATRGVDWESFWAALTFELH